MLLISFLRYGLLILLPLSITLTTWLYLYPVFHGCAFPLPDGPGTENKSPFLTTLGQHVRWQGKEREVEKAIAPFRLLALGDPQLEGDTSIPDPDAFSFPHLRKTFQELVDTTKSPFQRLRFSVHSFVDFWFDDIPKTLEGWRKLLDLIGNDYYLAHIYRTLYWWSNPTHVSVLGDLVGSQWISDEEFEIRGARFWNRVFKGGVRVPDDVTSSFASGADMDEGVKTYTLGEDAELWKRRVINIAGNHDVGYAGDLTPERFERFERVFGRANYEIRFKLPMSDIQGYNATEEWREVPELRIVVLNDMNLDTPAVSKELQDETYVFINAVINASPPVSRPALFTLLLTHVPLYKVTGVCVDAPFFLFHDSDEFAYGVKEQNHLSDAASRGLLEGIFGMNGDPHGPGRGVGRHGIVVTGHDHEGCDVWHFINQTEPERESVPPVPAVDIEQKPSEQAYSDGMVSSLDSAMQEESSESAKDTSFDSLKPEPSSLSDEIDPVRGLEIPNLAYSSSEASGESSTHAFETYSLSDFGPTPEASAAKRLSKLEYSPAEIGTPSIPFVSEPLFNADAESILARASSIASIVADSESTKPTAAEIPSDSEIELPETVSQSEDALFLTKNNEEDAVAVPEWLFLSTPESESEVPEPERPLKIVPEPWRPSWSAFPYHHALSHKDTATGKILPELRTSGVPGIREITLRSMMGEFSGHAGLISLWFDREEWEWKSEIADCALGRQHWWWVVHVLDFISIIGVVLFAIASVLEKAGIIVDIPIERWWQEYWRERGVKRKARDLRKHREVWGNGNVMGIGIGSERMKVVEEAQLVEAMRKQGWIVMREGIEIDNEDAGTSSEPQDTPEKNRSLRKKRSKRSLNGSFNGNDNGNGNRSSENKRRPLSSVFEK